MKEFIEVVRDVNISLFVFLLITTVYLQADGGIFPQEKVDKVCLENREKGLVQDTREQIVQTPLTHERSEGNIIMNKGYFIKEGFSSRDDEFSFDSYNKNDLNIGPELDTFLIDTNYVQEGNIIIYGQGVLLVDNAQLTLSGHLYAQNQGQAIFINNAHLHFNQFYVGQYFVWLVDTARFEATDAIVDANGVMHYAQFHNHSTYIARRVYFPDWTFRKVFNRATLILEDVYHVGDLMVDDSCFVHFTRCDTLMPWFEMRDGSVVNIQFPDPDFVDHFELSDNTPNVDGIGYTFIADSCSQCWWSLETLPGCNVTINNSTIRGSCVRMFGSDTFNINGIENYTYHSSLTVPLSDRYLKYIDTY
ncbi:hypothetical protein KAX35_03625, partial [candidate division WOR-3 bacterium]|nr:hypothetical protein [candidate division WOR-3 bacterium]